MAEANTETANKAATEEIPRAKIVSPKERSKTVPMDWPVEYDGKVWEEITVRRMTAREADDFGKAIIEQSEDDPRLMFPNVECPRAVYDEMDADDRHRVEEAALLFLPRRFRMLVDSTFETSETSSEK